MQCASSVLWWRDAPPRYRCRIIRPFLLLPVAVFRIGLPKMGWIPICIRLLPASALGSNLGCGRLFKRTKICRCWCSRGGKWEQVFLESCCNRLCLPCLSVRIIGKKVFTNFVKIFENANKSYFSYIQNNCPGTRFLRKKIKLPQKIFFNFIIVLTNFVILFEIANKS